MNKQIVLIGMPGCGKTTIGKKISAILGIPFFDTDKYIENKFGQTIDELFLKGEDYFREKETLAIKDISRFCPCVISTGGGIVKKEENMAMLNNGIIFYINRPIENIIKDIDYAKRPLLRDNPLKIFDLYNERKDLYKKYCHFEIINDDSIEEAVNKIIKIILNLHKV